MKVIAILTVFLGLAAGAVSGPTKVQEAAKEVDALLAAHWKQEQVTPNPALSDEAFLRRIYLDVAGRIPTLAEARAFLDSKAPGKREALIDELLKGPAFVANFYNFWADILRLKSTYVNTANVVPAAYSFWLKQSLRTNKPYRQFVHELLSAQGYCWENGAIGYYLRDPEMPLDNMALTTRVFLGTRIECAQCHDHPFDKWKQTEFYHLAAFTYGNKSVNESLVGVRDAFRARENAILEDFKKEKSAAPDGGKIAEQKKNERLEAMQFRTVLAIIRHGIGQLLSPVGLERKSDTVLKLPHDFKGLDGKPGDVMKPQTLFGRTEALRAGSDGARVFADWVTAEENPMFTRVIVNRLWKKMFGVALSEPLDDLRQETKAKVPELEAYLVRLMVSLRYDSRAFLAVLANTHAYQSAACPDEYSPEKPWRFQGPALRRMSAEQIWDSFVVLANHEPDARDEERERRDARRIGISHMVYDAYAGYDGTEIVNLAYQNLESENSILAREKAAREAEVKAKRGGDKTRETELRRELDRLQRERQERYVKDFLNPLLGHLAQKKGGPSARPVIDEGYKLNTNPTVFAVETWRSRWVPGYGPEPRTVEQVNAEAKARTERLTTLAKRLDFSDGEVPGFLKYCERANAEWLRASELESPAPRGHFLRTMGQSDRDFVENANPNSTIPQALALTNGEMVSAKGIFAPYSPLMCAVNRATSMTEKLDAAWLAVLSRHPLPDESAEWVQALKDGTITMESLVRAILNSKTFIFLQ